MRVLVTGGAGFLGSHLCDLLLREGHEVVALDNLLTGRAENLAHLDGETRFELARADLTRDPLPPAEAVFHLASPASPVGYGRHPIETMRVNSEGTYRALELARQRGARFLLASTSEVYGEPEEHPQPETYRGNVDPVGAHACYAEAKRYAEAMTAVYEDHHGVDARIVRIFNCYGPRSDPADGRMVPNLVTQAVTEKPMTVYGDGAQTRSLCYVADLVDGLHRAMFHEGTRGEIFNLGNPDERTVLEFAQLVQRVTGTSSEIVHLELPSGDITRRCPNIEKAATRLGWRPSTPLEEGLRLTVAWFRDVLGLAAAPGQRSPAG